MKMETLKPEDKRGWTIRINGQEVEGVGLLEIESKFGRLVYGKRPEGYDSWVFEEQGGGGAVTILYAEVDGEILIGLREEPRANMGEKPRLCVIGGFVDLGEDHQQTQQRVLEEESGLSLEAQKLPGLPVNANRAFWVADPDKDEGVHIYALKIPAEYLILDEQNPGSYLLTPEILGSRKKPVRFLPLAQAVNQSPDVIALAAIARLMVNVL